MSGPPVESVEVSCYTVPTDAPESDGSLAWDSTTLVLVEIAAGGRTGIGYTYSDTAAATLVRGKLAGLVEGMDAFDVRGGLERDGACDAQPRAAGDHLDGHRRR